MTKYTIRGTKGRRGAYVWAITIRDRTRDKKKDRTRHTRVAKKRGEGIERRRFYGIIILIIHLIIQSTSRSVSLGIMRSLKVIHHHPVYPIHPHLFFHPFFMYPQSFMPLFMILIQAQKNGKLFCTPKLSFDPLETSCYMAQKKAKSCCCDQLIHMKERKQDSSPHIIEEYHVDHHQHF